MRLVGAIVAWLILVATASAQDSAQLRTFVRFQDTKTTIPVAAPVSAEMLRVRVDGKPVRIDSLKNASDVPVRYIVLFDESGSGRKSPNIHAVRMAVPEFLAKIVRPDKDKVALVNFNDEFYLDVDLTSDLEQFSKKLRTTEDYRGGTAFCDAIIAASNYLKRRAGPAPERRVMLLFSDGEDNASRASNIKTVVEVAIRDGVQIVALSVAGSPGASRGTPGLRELTSSTGGRLFEKVEPRQAEDFFAALRRVLESEYVLTYTPAEAGAKNQLSKFEVTTTLPNVVAVAPRTVVQ